jgi:hypothetical protein
MAVASLAGGCTTVLYKGPRRPEAEIAVLSSTHTLIDKVDTVKVADSASGNHVRLEVLPGYHEVAIRLYRVIPGFLSNAVQRSQAIVVCVTLEPGHTYRTEAVLYDRRWEPQVVDEATGAPLDPSCDEEEPAPPTAAATPVPAAPPPVAAAPVEVVAAPAPERQPKHVLAEAEAQVSERQPGTGLSLILGFGYGGADLVTVTDQHGGESTLSAGTGLIVGVGGMVTPLWASEHAGFGLGVDGTLKYDSVTSGGSSASVRRFPIAVMAHLLTNGAGGPHYFLLRGGVARDFGVDYDLFGAGAGLAGIHGTWGPTGSVGYYLRSNDYFAWDVTASFTFTDHVADGVRLSARSAGLTLGLHFNP